MSTFPELQISGPGIANRHRVDLRRKLDAIQSALDD